MVGVGWIIWVLVCKKEIRTMTFLTNKGMVKTDVYKLVFYPKIVRNIVLLALSVGLFSL